ncbi:right-handed parallel beta-helix repeat-containing protein [Streptomyces tauricus]|uniref:right-handed parallel beta-helix repeat-containing protein n=1 Tax=Streptomyces tauricus TaxID=68274 RepID=UPI00387F1CA2
MDITAARLNSMQQAASLLVTNYGADSSGTTNAAPGIQLALNAARDLGGAQVVVPPGIYLIGATLRIYGNTRLSLMAGAEFRRNVAGTMIVNGDAGQAFGGYTGHSDIIIEGGLWNMRGTTVGLTASAMCISIGHASDIIIRDLEVRDLPGYHAVEFNSTIHGTIQNCRFRGFIDPGGRDFAEAVQIDLAKSVGVFGGFGPYDHTPCEDITVTGCYFGASGTAGTTAWPRGIGSHSATITKWHRRIRISGNAFENLLQFAISAYVWEDVTIVGNTFNSCGSGVRIRSVIAADTEDTKLPDGTQTSASQSMRNFAVVGNTLRDCGSYDNSIIVLGETTGLVLSLVISGNVIDGTTTQAGIRIQRASRAVVNGNTVSNTGGTGISTEDQSNMIVSDNLIWGVGGHGITMVSCDNSNILDNDIRDPANSGILVQGGSDIQIRNNFVDGANHVASSAYGIRISTSTVSPAVSGNKCRPGTSTTKALAGLSTTNTVTGLQRFGNDMRGTWSGAAGGIDDLSTSPQTVATDIE